MLLYEQNRKEFHLQRNEKRKQINEKNTVNENIFHIPFFHILARYCVAQIMLQSPFPLLNSLFAWTPDQ
jgi:hypothetical protein